ncbi:MAG: hypothetical protein ACQR33_04995 [Candidatus Saccharibacteria bacterium]
MKNHHKTYESPLSHVPCFGDEDVEAFTGALVGFWGRTDEEWEQWRQERLIEDEVGAALIRSIGKLGLADDAHLTSA